MGVPSGHSHMRLIVETERELIVLEEATVTNVARAYIWVKNHPMKRNIELLLHRIGEKERKHGYAEYQLLESERAEEEVQLEIDALLRKQ